MKSSGQTTLLGRGLRATAAASAVALVALLAGFPEAARAADVDIRPIAASGLEGVDWVAGPGPNEITLFDGGQDVAIEIFISNLGTDNVAAYQFAQDCNYDFDISGSIDPYGVECPIAGLPFDSGLCSGVDTDRPDWILAAADATIAVCGTATVCPDGVTGKIICGAVLAAGNPGAGVGEFYGATFGFAVSADAKGSATVGIDPDPMATLIRDVDGEPVPIGNVTNGTITIQTGNCCGVAGAPLGCLSPVTVSECIAAGAGFIPGGACSGVATCVPGWDGACPTCDPIIPEACNDNNACTADFCDGFCCFNTDTTPAGMCCAWTNGALTPIDDGDPCTVDTCQNDGSVTHSLTIACGEPMGSRYVRFTPPCGTGPTCDDVTMMALRLSGAVPAQPGAFAFLGYVQPNGTLSNQPVYNTPVGWGSVVVSGPLIRSNTSYQISGELMAGGGLVGTSEFPMPELGDVDGDTITTFADIQAVVRTFQGVPGMALEPADVAPCIPNGVVNFEDVQWAVFGFQSQVFESVCPIGVCCSCPDVCFDYGGFGELQASCGASGNGGQWTGGVSCDGFTCQPNCACDGPPECSTPCPSANSCLDDAMCGPGSVCTPWTPELPCIPSVCTCDVKTGDWVCTDDCSDQCVPGGG